MPWITLEDGTPVHVTMAKHSAKLTAKDIEALRAIAEAARRKYGPDIPVEFREVSQLPTALDACSISKIGE